MLLCICVGVLRASVWHDVMWCGVALRCGRAWCGVVQGFRFQAVVWHRFSTGPAVVAGSASAQCLLNQKWHTDKCPLCPDKVESVYHSLRYCKFFPHVYVCLSRAFGLPTDTWRTGPFHEFKQPHQILLWTARKAHWHIRCRASFHGNPTLPDFVSHWATAVTSLIEWQPFDEHQNTFSVFLRALRKYDGTCSIPHLGLGRGKRHPDVPPPKKSKKSGHEMLVPELLAHLDLKERDGWTLGFTDGSADTLPGGGQVGGFGGHIPALGLEFAHPLPTSEAQTNNRAELRAAIFLLEHTPPTVQKLLIATDSKYVRDGMQGSAYRWKSNHWCNNKGPVPNADLC